MAPDERLSFEEFGGIRVERVSSGDVESREDANFAFRVYDLQDTGEINRDRTAQDVGGTCCRVRLRR